MKKKSLFIPIFAIIVILFTNCSNRSSISNERQEAVNEMKVLWENSTVIKANMAEIAKTTLSLIKDDNFESIILELAEKSKENTVDIKSVISTYRNRFPEEKEASLLEIENLLKKNVIKDKNLNYVFQVPFFKYEEKKHQELKINGVMVYQLADFGNGLMPFFTYDETNKIVQDLGDMQTPKIQPILIVGFEIESAYVDKFGDVYGGYFLDTKYCRCTTVNGVKGCGTTPQALNDGCCGNNTCNGGPQPDPNNPN